MSKAPQCKLRGLFHLSGPLAWRWPWRKGNLIHRASGERREDSETLCKIAPLSIVLTPPRASFPKIFRAGGRHPRGFPPPATAPGRAI